MDHILAIDLGTSGMKSVLFSPEGRIVAQAVKNYNTEYQSGGRAEQQPDDWWQALIACCRDIETKMKETDNPRSGKTGKGGLDTVVAIGISGQMMAGLGIDGSGRPAAPALIHADTRASAETAAFVAALGAGAVDVADVTDNAGGARRIYHLTGHRPSPAYSGAKMAWLKQHQPEIYRSIECFLNPKDYLNFRLTGERVTEWSDASGTLLFNIHERCWDDELIDAFQLDAAKLPPVLPSSEVIGRVSKDGIGDHRSPTGCCGSGRIG